MLRYFNRQTPQADSFRKTSGLEKRELVSKVFSLWGVNGREAQELLGGIGASTWRRWGLGYPIKVSRDLNSRIDLLLSIHDQLSLSPDDPDRGYAWLRRPNPMLGGSVPLDLMICGTIMTLARIESYLVKGE